MKIDLKKNEIKKINILLPKKSSTLNGSTGRFGSVNDFNLLKN